VCREESSEEERHAQEKCFDFQLFELQRRTLWMNVIEENVPRHHPKLGERKEVEQEEVELVARFSTGMIKVCFACRLEGES
jgi:hypothetical protein